MNLHVPAEERRTQRTFRALLEAMAYPSRVFPLKASSPKEALLRVAETLVDGRVALHAPAHLASALAHRGVRVVPPEEADYVFLEDAAGLENLLPRVRLGHPLAPEEGATLVVAAPLGRGPLLRARGPGIPGEASFRLQVPLGVWPLRESLLSFPLGFDLIQVDGRGVLALPRTVEVRPWDT